MANIVGRKGMILMSKKSIVFACVDGKRYTGELLLERNMEIEVGGVKVLDKHPMLSSYIPLIEEKQEALVTFQKSNIVWLAEIK